MDDVSRLKRNAYMREWKKKNKPRVNRYNQSWKDKNRDKVRENERRYAKVARKRDPEKFKKLKAAFRARHPERPKREWRNWYLKNSSMVLGNSVTRIRKNPQHYLWRLAKCRAKEKGLPFSIEPSDLIIPETCPVLEIPLRILGGGRWCANSASVDRVIPALGYVKGNVRVISWRANAVKSNSTLQELEAVIRYLKGSIKAEKPEDTKKSMVLNGTTDWMCY